MNRTRFIFWIGVALLGIFLLALSPLALVTGCSKQPAAEPTLTAAAVIAELPRITVTCDDARYTPLEHAWLERALDRHLAQTWHDRPYVPELKDCDDYTDFLVANVRHWFGEQAAADAGGALIGRYTIWIAEASAWHRVALVRTEHGWFVVDPQRIATAANGYHSISIIPLATYARPARSVAF